MSPKSTPKSPPSLLWWDGHQVQKQRSNPPSLCTPKPPCSQRWAPAPPAVGSPHARQAVPVPWGTSHCIPAGPGARCALEPAPGESRCQPRVCSVPNLGCVPVPAPIVPRSQPQLCLGPSPSCTPVPSPVLARCQPQLCPGASPKCSVVPAPDVSRCQPHLCPGAIPSFSPVPPPV